MEVRWIIILTWWITEALPMPVVALVPLVLLPLLKISNIEEVSKSYSNPVVFLFMGGFMIGLAIEKWKLHKRIHKIKGYAQSWFCDEPDQHHPDHTLQLVHIAPCHEVTTSLYKSIIR